MATQYQTVKSHPLTALQKTYDQQTQRDRRAAALDRIRFKRELAEEEA